MRGGTSIARVSCPRLRAITYRQPATWSARTLQLLQNYPNFGIQEAQPQLKECKDAAKSNIGKKTVLQFLFAAQMGVVFKSKESQS